jgi:hypothetical protein
VVNAASVSVRNCRIHLWLIFQLDGAARGNVDLNFFVKINVVLVEIVVGPELARSQSRMNHRDDVIFEHFPRTQARDCNVFLTVVGVDRSLLLKRSAQILDGIITRLHHSAVGFDNADVSNFDSFVGGVIPNLNLTPLLNSSLALHANSSDGFLAAGAVVFETVDGLVLLDDEGFLRVIVFCCFGSRSRGVGRFRFSCFGAVFRFGWKI